MLQQMTYHTHIRGLQAPPLCVSLEVLSGYPPDQMPGHTHGGLDTYHCVSVNISSDYSVHQICYYIHIHHIITDALEYRCNYVWANLISVCLITHITLQWKSPSV